MSVDAPSSNVPSVSVFSPKSSCQILGSYLERFSGECADRQTGGQTDRLERFYNLDRLHGREKHCPILMDYMIVSYTLRIVCPHMYRLQAYSVTCPNHSSCSLLWIAGFKECQIMVQHDILGCLGTFSGECKKITDRLMHITKSPSYNAKYGEWKHRPCLSWIW